VIRALRPELRRAAATGAVLLVVTLALTHGLTGPWTHGAAAGGGLLPLVLGQRNVLDLTWAVAVGLGAVLGIRDHRSGMVDLLASTPRPVAQRMGATAAAVALALVLAQVVAFAVAVARFLGSDYATADWVAPALAGLLVVVAGALGGMAAGALLPSPATPPAAVAVALAGPQLLLGDHGNPVEGLAMRWELLRPSMPVPRAPFTTVAGAVSAGQALAFGGLAVGAVLVLVLRGRRGVAALPVLLGLVAGLAVLPDRTADAYPVDTRALPLVCDEAGPPVCVTRVDAHRLQELVGPGRAALRALSVLPDAPTRVVEVPVRWEPTGAATRLAPAPSDALAVDLAGYGDSPRPLPGHPHLGLLVGAGTLACGPEGSPDTAARYAAMIWLGGTARTSVAEVRPHRAEADPEWAALVARARDALFAQPREEQVRRVAALRAAALACRGGLWQTLTGQ
jgi:hypothetical protein